MANQRIENINPQILRQCREQIGLSIEQAEKKAKLRTLASIEAGERYPTIKQIENLAKRYHVPTWVFVEKELPAKYCFDNFESYRKFQNNSISSYEVRSVIANVERLRELLLEFRDDIEEPVKPFSPPRVIESDFKATAEIIRKWLGCTKISYSLIEWKRMLENKNVFIFTTSKYRSWLKVAPDKFRGLSIYYDILPIIVINNSDAHKAQSFTLFHELGHLLKKQTVLDEQKEIELQKNEEKWCDIFSGAILMPQENFLREVKTFSHEQPLKKQIKNIEKLAKKFQVSSYAFLVRMKHLNSINQSQYDELVDQLRKNYLAYKNKLKKGGISKSIAKEPLEQYGTIYSITKEGGISRDIAKDALEQYGTIYSKAVTQMYRNQEISLHKFCKLLGIKKVSDALKLETLL